MNTKELIQQLQMCDPEGTAVACIDNFEIIDVRKEPAYYDGRLKRAIKHNGFDVDHIHIESGGSKISFMAFDMESEFLRNPDLSVTFTRT